MAVLKNMNVDEAVSQFPAIEKWLKTRKKSRVTLFSSWKQWFEWITENVDEFRDVSPDMLIEYQRKANVNGDVFDARYFIGEKTIDLLLERGSSGKWRRGYQKKVLSSVRSFFKANRAPLPDDEHYRVIDRSEAPEDAPERLSLEVAKHLIDNSNEMYKAILLAMIGGGLGIGEILKWSAQGVDSVKEGLFKVNGQELLRIEFSSRKSNYNPYFTLIGGDALHALKVWLSARERKKLSYEKKGGHYPPDIFVTKTNTALKRGHTIRTFWLRKLDRIGRIEREKGAPPSTRYGFNPHQMRDRFKSQWMLAHKGRGDKISEFLMGHRIDSYNYNRFYESQAGQELIYQEYLKTLTYLNIISSTIPFGLVDSSDLTAVNQEVDLLKRLLQELKQENEVLQKSLNQYKAEFEVTFESRLHEMEEERHYDALVTILFRAKEELERDGFMILPAESGFGFTSKYVTQEDINRLEKEVIETFKKLNSSQQERLLKRRSRYILTNA